jgi:hypothetical protein
MPRTRSIVQALAMLLLGGVTSAAVTPAGRWSCGPALATAPSPVEGRVLIMPGVGNTRFHLAGFVAATQLQLPRFDVEVRTWGEPFMTIHNLRAHEYPIASAVLPHVREFVVNYASTRDLQVGWGTRTFGTIDRKNTASAGAIGFAAEDDRLLQYHWSSADVRFGHAGNHLAYLNGRWQAEKLLPALDPARGPEALKRQWARTCKES